MAGGGMGVAPTQSGQPTGFSGLFGDGSTPGTIMQGTGLPPQGGMMGLGGGQLYTGGYGLPMMSPTQQAPVGAPPPTTPAATAAPTATPTTPASLQFGTTGTGTAGEPQASPMAQQMQAPAPMQNPYARPMPQQMYRPQMMQQQYGGLQSLLAGLMNRYQQPQQRVSQMPQYQSSAAGYRPNLAQAQTNLSRTATTKAEAQAAAESAALAKLGLQGDASANQDDADFRAWQRRQYEASKYNYGG